MPTASCDALTTQHLGHVRRTARGLSPLDRGELTAVGNLQLVRCAAAYDASRGEFWPWAHTRIRGGMIDHLRAETHRGHLVPALLSDAEWEAEHLCAWTPDMAAWMDAKAALAALPQRLRRVFLLREGGFSATELATAEGVSISRISQLYGEARRRMAAAMAA
jgi:RNA polymerase sigma factor (sigma-70 family)